MSADFIQWVRSPDRTQEELITIERLTEAALPLWRSRHSVQIADYREANAAEKERRHQRCHNPAYLPTLLDVALERTAEVLGEIEEFSFKSGSEADRTARALSPLRWLPRLTRLTIDKAELADPHVIAELTGLRQLHLTDALLDDVKAVGACRELRELHLCLSRPWPDLSALAALVQLESFTFYGNIFALADVPALPQVRTASFSGSGLAPRDLRGLPEMPQLEFLDAGPVFGLAGLERYPQLRTLTLKGPMEDLRPLAALRALTYLELGGDHFRSVAPLATLPELRWAVFSTARPRDYSPLAEAPRLHEVEVRGCDVHELELGVLHAALDPWDTEWALPEPRPLPREGRFLYHAGNDYSPWWPLEDPPEATWHGDGMMEIAERRWFQRSVQAAAAAFLGEPEFNASGRHSGDHPSREGRVRLSRYDYLEKLPGLLEVLRGVLARTRFRHAIHVGACITVAEARGLEGERSWRDEETEEERRARWEEDKRLKREQLDREHRFELLKSEGAAIDPEDFAAPPLDEDKVLVPAGMENMQPTTPWERREVDPEEESFDPDAWQFDPELDDWSFAVHFTVTLTEEALIVQDYDAATARYYLGRKPEKLRDTRR